MSMWSEVVDRDAGWQDITVRKGKDRPQTWQQWVLWGAKHLARGIWWLLVLAVSFAVVCWPIGVPLLGAAWLALDGAPWLALALVLTITVGYGCWFWFTPGSFELWVSAWVRRWRRLRRYRKVWTHLMVGAKLTVKDGDRRELVPHIVRVRQGRFADVLTIRMPAGLPVERFTGHLPAITEATHAREARLVPAPAGLRGRLPSWLQGRLSAEFAPTSQQGRKVHLRLTYGDALVHTIRHQHSGGDEGTDGPGFPAAEPTAVDLAAVPVGRRDDGRSWSLSLLGTHILLAGATGSGKGSVLWSLLASLGPAIRDGLVQVVGVDPKGGMELGYGRELFRELLTMDGDDADKTAVEFLEALANEADRRAAMLAGHARTLEPSRELPFLVIVLDELASLTAFIADSKLRARSDAALGRLLTKGRAPGMCVIGAIQDPRKEVVKWRDLFPTRIALRLVERSHVDMVLGDGARDRGATCDLISEAAPGVGYQVEDGSRAVTRIRAAYLTDADIRHMATTYQPGPTIATPLRAIDGGDAA